MRESIRLEIEAEYEAQRNANWQEEARRLEEASAADPAIGRLVQERTQSFQSQARAALANPAHAEEIVRNLTGRITTIQAELRRRLVTAGFAEDYLQPIYHCTECRDTGYVGEPVRTRCACFDRKKRARVSGERAQGLDIRETFDLYDEGVFDDQPLKDGKPGDTQRSLTGRIRDYCQSYASLFPNTPKPNLLLAGKSGLGKTFLLNCIGNTLHERGFEVLKLTAYQLTERMRAAVFDRDRDAYASLLDVQLLLIDDLGVEPMLNGITIEHLFTLLNERMLADLPTAISTNLDALELKERYTERVCSRLFDKRTTTMLLFNGRDVRLRSR